MKSRNSTYDARVMSIDPTVTEAPAAGRNTTCGPDALGVTLKFCPPYDPARISTVSPDAATEYARANDPHGADEEHAAESEPPGAT